MTEAPPTGPCLFALGASEALVERIAQILGTRLAPHEAREFEDGEHKLRQQPGRWLRGRRDCG